MECRMPLIPGLTFNTVKKTSFHARHHLDVVNGYPLMKKPESGDSMCCVRGPVTIRLDPALQYGRTMRPAPPPALPHFVLYAGKCLCFKAFMKQTVLESQLEHYRIRPVNIAYFLEDDTITVVEPATRNAGFLQGKMIRRGRIPKTADGHLWHWKDLNVGVDVDFYGKVFHIVDCDAFTREYLASQGVEVPPAEVMPDDPYSLERRLRGENQRPMTVTPSLDTKLRRFLEFGGKVLRFYCVWDDRDMECEPDLRPFIFFYHLEDDTVEVKEVHKDNDGRDPFPMLLRRMKLPRDYQDIPVDFPAGVMEVTEDEVMSYYTPPDLVIGRTIFVLGRRFLIYNCDAFTRNYYEKILGITQPCPIDPFPIKEKAPPPEIPPYNGWGTPEDSYQNVISVIPKPPKTDVVKQLLNANKILKYSAHLDPVRPEDEGRHFIIEYHLADATIAVNEVPRRNSGFIEGRFLRPHRIHKPGTSVDDLCFYTPVDMWIGARLILFQHHFIIDGCDTQVYRYMQDNPEKFPANVVDNVRSYLAGQGRLAEDVAARATVMEREEKKVEEEVTDAATRIPAEGEEIPGPCGPPKPFPPSRARRPQPETVSAVRSQAFARGPGTPAGAPPTL